MSANSIFLPATAVIVANTTNPIINIFFIMYDTFIISFGCKDTNFSLYFIVSERKSNVFLAIPKKCFTFASGKNKTMA